MKKWLVQMMKWILLWVMCPVFTVDASGLMVNGNELINVGDRRNTGTILYYPQDHRLFEERFSEYVEGSLFCENVAKSQFRILRQLNSWGCRIIFSEEHLEKMRLEDVGSIHLDTIRFYFDEGIPRRPSELQKAVLYEYGAAFVYLCLKEGVTIMPTIRAEDYMFINMQVEHALSRGEDLPMTAFEERELLALEEIESYFHVHPGRKVALIFGYHHQFVKHINGDFNPKFLVSR